MMDTEDRHNDNTGRPGDDAAASPLARRRRRLLTAVALATVASIAGLAGSTLVKSPEQLAADTRPPPATVLTAAVVRKVLSTSLVMRGSFSAGRQFTFAPRSVASSAAGPGGDTLIVTAVRTREGAAVRPGKVLLEVSERPVYALPGAFPAYRDLMPGQTGKDIASLRAGLARLGYPSSDRPRYFGAGTEAAVTRFYRAIGYPVPLTPADAKAGPAEGGPAEGGESAPSPSVSTRPRGPAARPKPMVPRSEVAFLPDLPARVADLPVRVGDTVPDRLITFTTGDLTLTAKLNPETAGLVKTGMKARIASETTGFDGSGTVASIGRKPSPAGEGESPYLPVRIAREKPWPRDLLGDDVRVTITTASSGEAVLAVPEAAVTSSADGRTSVTVRESDHRQRVVEVTTGVSAGGMVEVAVPHGQLSPGQRVVTGR
jgi:peptidoglycan hydrolase-like protein with peptidoglycan-binding domain